MNVRSNAHPVEDTLRRARNPARCLGGVPGTEKGLFHPTSTCPFPGYGLGIIDSGDGWYGHTGLTVGFQSLWSFNKYNRNGYVIHGQKNFDEVWTTVSAVEQVLKSELELPCTLRYFLLAPPEERPLQNPHIYWLSSCG